MRVVKIQFIPWDKTYYFLPNDLPLIEGEKVIVKTEIGMEIGTVLGFEDVSEEELSKYSQSPRDSTAPTDSGSSQVGEEDDKDSDNNGLSVKPVIRVATESDKEKIPSQKDREQALLHVLKVKEKHNLPMKIIDVHYAFDGSRITFAFIADGRVDFREMVKDLTRHFGRTIRLQQIGIRDEAKIMGDYGHCGRGLCCRGHLDKLESITSEMADIQQCSHRGSERISGVCGRLMCCLAYEEKGYEELTKKFPPIGTKIKLDGKEGSIIGYHTLKQTVDVEFLTGKEDDRTVVEIDLKTNKKVR